MSYLIIFLRLKPKILIFLGHNVTSIYKIVVSEFTCYRNHFPSVNHHSPILDWEMLEYPKCGILNFLKYNTMNNNKIIPKFYFYSKIYLIINNALSN